MSKTNFLSLFTNIISVIFIACILTSCAGKKQTTASKTPTTNDNSYLLSQKGYVSAQHYLNEAEAETTPALTLNLLLTINFGKGNVSLCQGNVSLGQGNVSLVQGNVSLAQGNYRRGTLNLLLIINLSQIYY